MMVLHSGNGSLQGNRGQGNRGLHRVAGAFEAGNHRQTLGRCLFDAVAVGQLFRDNRLGVAKRVQE